MCADISSYGDTYNQHCRVYLLAVHQNLAHMLTPQPFLGNELGECPTGLAIFAGHD